MGGSYYKICVLKDIAFKVKNLLFLFVNILSTSYDVMGLIKFSCSRSNVQQRAIVSNIFIT